ncbi:hypothetical protein IFE17_04115 [Actinobacillus sp. GY-402]|nr:hypothetical protein IFE17_04115 [Actinobacillus sp. GY-402]
MKKLLFLTALSVSTLSLTACIIDGGYYGDGYHERERYDRHYDPRDRDSRRDYYGPERRAAEARRRANEQVHKAERRSEREERERRDIYYR